MIPKATLISVAEDRIRDAEALHAARRFDGAVYLCGYAVEMGLKARTCTSLNWLEFPDTKAEFKNFLSFKTHELEVLLRLSGHETQIRATHLPDWSIVTKWDPEARYEPVGTVLEPDSADMIQATKNILAELKK